MRELPASLTLDEAFRAAVYMTEQYVGLERDPTKACTCTCNTSEATQRAGTTGGARRGGARTMVARLARSIDRTDLLH